MLTALNFLSANPTKWSNKLKQLFELFKYMFYHFMGLGFNGLKSCSKLFREASLIIHKFNPESK